MTIYPIFRRLLAIFSLALLITTGALVFARQQPAQSPWLIFASNQNHDFDDELYRIALDGKHQKRITYIPGYESLQGWTLDGRWMLVHSGANGLLYHVDPTLGVIQSRIPFPSNFEAWSPDGEWMILRSNGYRSNDLFRIRADGTNLEQLTFSAGLDQFLSWTPDQEWMIVVSDGELYRLSPDGRERQQLTTELLADRPLPFRCVNSWDWTPDGMWLIFDYCWGYYNGTDQQKSAINSLQNTIFRIRSDGSQIEPLTDNQGQTRFLTLSPDGEWIYFKWIRFASGFDLYRMRVNGSELQTLTTNGDFDDFIRWSPDGDWFIYDLIPGTVMKMRPDGSEKGRYLPTESQVTSALWSPDDEWLFYREYSYNTGPKLFSERRDGSETTELKQGNRAHYIVGFAPPIDLNWQPARLLLLSLLAITLPQLAHRRMLRL